jgi:NAD(P)-dependent dehydrogenase (short-subunit alcohol dehydrogenase family)
MRLAGKTAVITGAGSGLGREGALLFAREGASVVVMDRVPDRAADVAKQITGAGGIAQHFDGVSDQADMAGAVDLGLERFGKLGIMWASSVQLSAGGLGASWRARSRVGRATARCLF